MKFFFIIILTAVLIFQQMPSKASHAVGGEITWTCVGNGKYKFRFIFYTDCNGIFPSNSFPIETNVPGVSIIQTNLIQINDLILPGLQSDGISPCFNCSTNPPSGVQIGLIRESIYESDSIFLPGIPPPTGWWFIAGECCRFSMLSNIPSASTLDFATRAVMFPFNGQVPGQCSDNSPYFVEKPKPTFCIGQPLEMNYATKDIDGDQLSYDWAYPIDGSGNNVMYGGSYSLSNPFPGPQQNPMNTYSVLNNKTGQLSLTNYNTGVYASVIKATSFKCNQKVAEIYREYTSIFVPNCNTILGGNPNHLPNCNAPFFDNVTGLQTSYSDTVSVGDTVSFFLNASDLDFFTNGTLQQITMSGEGNQFGTNFTDPNSGCQNPPCATLSQTLPVTSSGIINVGFQWITTCDHLYDTSACQANSKTYYFNIKIIDNYCYSNGIRSVPFSITVVGAKITVATNATTLCTTSSPVPLTASPAGGSWSGSGVTGSLFDPAISGTGSHNVSYSYTDLSGCIYTDQVEFTVNNCTGLNMIDNDYFDVSPHVTSTTTTVIFNDKVFSGTIAIADLNGRIILTIPVDKQSQYELSLVELPPAMYQIIISNNSYIKATKIIKY
jgi:hypothetical protein